MSSKVGSKSSGVGACNVGSGDEVGLGRFPEHVGFSDPNVVHYGRTESSAGSSACDPSPSLSHPIRKRDTTCV